MIRGPGQATFLRLSLLQALLLVSACVPERDDDRPMAPPAEVAPGESLPAAAEGPSPVPAAAPDSADIGSLALVVEGDGLRLFVGPTASARPLPFGTSDPEIQRILTEAVGGSLDQVDSPECGATATRWPGGLSTYAQRGEFVGWWLDSDGSTLTTATGVGIGSTRADLEAAYVTEIFESTLGLEFSAGGLAGLLESAAPGARVIHLWAGATCIAR